MRQYKILSWEAALNGRAIYSLLPGKDRSVRIVIDRQADWNVDQVVTLDPAFVEASRETS